MYDIAIIGAGAIGSFVARELSKYALKILILEKDPEVSNGVTKANTAIVHSGYSPKENTLRAKLNKKAIQMFPAICKQLDIPYKKTGSLLIAFDNGGMKAVHEKYERGIKNGIKGLKILNKQEVLNKEPHLNPNVCGALYAQETGIVSNWELAIAACENAVDNGVNLKLNTKVNNIEKNGDIFYIYADKQIYKSKIVINCAGIFADEIHNMLAKPFFKKSPKKGQYFVLDKEHEKLINHVIFLAKDKDDAKRKGVIIAPTIGGNILIGPSSQEVNEKIDFSTTEEGLFSIKKMTKNILPRIDFSKTIKTFGALRPRIALIKEKDDFTIEEEKYEDFIIQESEDVGGFVNIAGIKSPGLTCAPSIALMVAEIVKQILGQMPLNAKFNPYRKKVVRLNLLSEEEKNKLIHLNPLYGKMVCRCENISEGEIIDSIRRNAGARTVDGIKRRTRAGMGRCQGGYCLSKILEILSRELDVNLENIHKSNEDSYILNDSR